MSMKAGFYDPVTEAFFADETLEYAERTGLALIAAAGCAPISFGKHVLPQVWMQAQDGMAKFSFAEGIFEITDSVPELLRKYPEDAEKINRYHRKFQVYHALAHKIYASDEIEKLGAGWGGHWGGHSNPDFGLVVNMGTNGIRRMIEQYSGKNQGADWFYRACSYAMDALDILGDRFRKLAEEMALECTDPLDKKRYELAAGAFSVIPREPAYDFTSACHAFWLIFTMDGIDSPGRFDQYMYRAYETPQDREEVQDVMERLWECLHDNRAWNLCLSGSTEDWEDETNELTYDILRLAARKKYQTPNITLRVHRNTPEKLWGAIADTLATGIGMPALYNDETVCTALEKLGIPPCDSHDYCMNGCNQIDIMGKSHMGLEDGEVYFGNLLDYALHNGMDSMRKEMAGLPTGDPTDFAAYEELEQAFYQQIEYAVLQICLAANAAQHARGAYSPNPLRSCLIAGCLEKGIDYRNGGPIYNHGQILTETIADTGDSLWAVKKLVYDEKKYTMEQLITALDADFEGYEQLRYDFSHCEKFGNDCREVDEITGRFINRFLELLNRHHTYRGGVYSGGCSTFNRAADIGRKTSALPNGHRRGEELVADSIGATPGRDVNGPTALLKSVLHYDQEKCGSGFVLQVKFDKNLFGTEKGKASFIALAKTYFAEGGQQYTVNVLDKEELEDAKRHPENHRDLIVRVGGYSDYFVDLEEGLQDNVIARTVN